MPRDSHKHIKGDCYKKSDEYKKERDCYNEIKKCKKHKSIFTFKQNGPTFFITGHWSNKPDVLFTFLSFKIFGREPWSSGYSCSEGCGFEFRHCILNGHFSHIFVEIFLMMFV